MNISRRELLIDAGLLFLSSACGSSIREFESPPQVSSEVRTATPVPVYNPRDYIQGEVAQFMQDINKEAIYRSASWTIYNSRGSYGHASLIRHNGRLAAYTAAHVPRKLSVDANTRQPYPLFLHVPGIDFYQLNVQGFLYKNRSDDDPPAIYYLDGDLERRIRDEVSKGVLRPLTLLTDVPGIGERVAIARADTGRYTVYANNTFLTNGYDYNLVWQNAGIVCSGRSGGAVLAINATGQVKPEVYGVVSSGKLPGRSDPLGKVSGSCFTEVKMKIN